MKQDKKEEPKTQKQLVEEVIQGGAQKVEKELSTEEQMQNAFDQLDQQREQQKGLEAHRKALFNRAYHELCNQFKCMHVPVLHMEGGNTTHELMIKTY